jgi:hypothetical protein
MAVGRLNYHKGPVFSWLSLNRQLFHDFVIAAHPSRGGFFLLSLR